MLEVFKKFIWLLLTFYAFNVHAELIISNAIKPIQYFTGREEQYLKIENQFIKAQKALSITGIAGIGKTQLSRHYIEKNKHKYEIIWVFDCAGNINEQFVALSKMLNSELCKKKKCSVSEDLDDAKNSVIQYLVSRDKWLLVFDNLKINDNNKIKDIIDLEHNGNIIFCSQDLKDLPTPIKLPYLSEIESKKLLSKVINTENFNEADLLLRTFNGFPILLVQSGLFLNENNYIDVTEYNNLFKKSKNKMKTHIDAVTFNLKDSAKDLMYKIAILNNHKISKNILKHISTDNTSIPDDIYNLVRFGVLINSDNSNIEFEMHDLVKDAILTKIELDTKRDYTNKLLDKFNHITDIKDGSLHRYSTIIKDESMISNHEKLLLNAELYRADIYKIMELRKNLMDFYGINKDYINCERMISWLKTQEDKKTLAVQNMTSKEKASYCWYLALIGMYDDTKYFEKAKLVLDNIVGYPRIVTGVYDIMALTYISQSKLLEAQSLIAQIERVNQNNVGKVNANRLLYVKAKMFLAQEKYNDALYFINTFIKEEENYVKSIAGNTYYIIKAEILNRMTRYKESNIVARSLYEREANKNINTIPLISILTQLSISELGLGDLRKSFEYMTTAKNLYNHSLKKENKEFNKHQDVVGDLLTLEGDILLSQNSYENAITAYKAAEKAYNNHFGLNTKPYKLSILYLKVAQTALYSHNVFLYKQYLNKHNNVFGMEDSRSKEILQMSL